MIEACKMYRMQPVCDHPSYCKNDAKSVYIGQTGHLAYPPNRRSVTNVPKGFPDIQKHWDGVCSYTRNANGNNALCNAPLSTHSWKNPYNYKPTGVMCARVKGSTSSIIVGSLGKMHGVPARTYEFKRAKLSG
jgi:hypothetical protein